MNMHRGTEFWFYVHLILMDFPKLPIDSMHELNELSHQRDAKEERNGSINNIISRNVEHFLIECDYAIALEYFHLNSMQSSVIK